MLGEGHVMDSIHKSSRALLKETAAVGLSALYLNYERERRMEKRVQEKLQEVEDKSDSELEFVFTQYAVETVAKALNHILHRAELNELELDDLEQLEDMVKWMLSPETQKEAK